MNIDENDPRLKAVINKYSAGPVSGIFTDGGATPNPGRGGWGAVFVKESKIIWQLAGFSENSTNNRMELTAIIESLKKLSYDDAVTIYADSQLCVNTLNIWAKNWEIKNWTKKGGEIKNLDLVKEAYELKNSHPMVKLEWTRGHNGWRWNEYADVLSRLWIG